MLPPSEVQIDLIRKLEANGILTPETARAAREHYVTSEPPSLMQRAASMLTVSNTFKALSVGALLMALTALLDILAPWLSRVPVAVYQLSLLAVANTATLRPDLFRRAQAPCVAVLATCTTFTTIWWILFTFEAFGVWLNHLERTGWPVACMLAGTSAAFFAATALMHDPKLLAVAAAGWLSVALTGGDIGARASLLHSVAGHLAALAAFISFKARGLYPNQIYVFAYAVEYYCTAALAFSLWAGCAVYLLGVAFLYTVAFATLAVAACVVYCRLAIKTPASMVACFTLLVVLAWVLRIEDSLGNVMTWVLVGVVLFGSGLLLDRHRGLLVFEAPRRPGGSGGGPGAGQVSAAAMPALAEDEAAMPLMGSEGAVERRLCLHNVQGFNGVVLQLRGELAAAFASVGCMRDCVRGSNVDAAPGLLFGELA